MPHPNVNVVVPAGSGDMLAHSLHPDLGALHRGPVLVRHHAPHHSPVQPGFNSLHCIAAALWLHIERRPQRCGFEYQNTASEEAPV